MVAPKSSNAPGPSVPQRKIDQATVTGSLAPDGPRTIQGAGKGKRVMVRSPEAAAQSGDALTVVGGGAQNTAEARVTSAQAPADAVIKQEAGSGTPSGVKLPLEVGTRLRCRWRDGSWHEAKIIERRPVLDAVLDTDYEYYVHYDKFNRRMDEWRNVDAFDLVGYQIEISGGEDGRTRNQKRKAEESHAEDEEHARAFEPGALREHEEFTKVKNVERIELGKYEMETWYFSPLPAEFNGVKKLYFAEYDLMFFKNRPQMLRHLRKTRLQHPPGDEIYRNGNVSMFEIDGRKEKMYCQNLCYLAKLFLDHKTLYYDVDLFLFYVLCECDERGAHVVGYFSKEKMSEEGYNLACILMLPCYQRKGYGKFLISFSYELSKIEGKVGTPERPLSDLGLVSYRGYWTRVLLHVLREHTGTISIKDLSDMTAIKTEDILTTLQHLNLIQYQKGQHVLVANAKVIEKHLKEAGSPGLIVDPGRIVWSPYCPERELITFRH